MAPTFSIREAGEQDIPEIMGVLIPSFEHIIVETALGNTNTPEDRKAAGKRHLRAWREHAAEFSMPCAIICVYTDPLNGKETIVAFAEWFIYDKPRSPEQYRKAHFLMSASWVPEEGGQRERAVRWLEPIVEGRVKWMGGRRSGLFAYMCVDKAWRRKGAATMCVQWGLDRCRKLGLPAYLEASEEGEPVYKKLGFEEVEKIHCDFDGDAGAFPAMVWWPPGTKAEDKQPACL